MKKLMIGLLTVAGMVTGAFAQTNLLQDPSADQGIAAWKPFGDARVEEADKNPHFAVRKHSQFIQTVKLDRSAEGKYALLVAHGSSDHLAADGDITGMPSLYGYMLSSNDPNGSKINTYLTGQSLLGMPTTPGEWVLMYGMFRVPADTVAAQIMLTRGERRGSAENRGAARFDNVGFYLFDTQKEALDFAKNYLR